MTTINKNILLGVCGGVAAYKSAELVRLLRKRDADVRVVMTSAAQHFVTPLTFQALSGHSVHCELIDPKNEQTMSHIHLARWADCLVIAPATANRLAKMAHGLADDLLASLYLAAECPVFAAPAMNQAMWHNPATQANVSRLKNYGVHMIGPETGVQACGENGMGRMAEPEAICARLLDSSDIQALKNLNVLITAGPTREPIDPVRFISNRSSGKMGYALANAARQAGAQVILISGPVNLTAPEGIKTINVETARQMYDAVLTNCTGLDLFIGAAAVADYRPAFPESSKIKKRNAATNIELQQNPDIIAAVSNLSDKPFTVGFAAETDNLESYAYEKLRSKNLDMIAANWVGKEQGGFESDRNALSVFWNGGQSILEMTDKSRLAEQLMQLIGERIKKRN